MKLTTSIRPLNDQTGLAKQALADLLTQPEGFTIGLIGTVGADRFSVLHPNQGILTGDFHHPEILVAQRRGVGPFNRGFESGTGPHVGQTGAGQTVKLVNQVLVVGNALAMCEALLLAQAGGVDLKTALKAVEAGAAGSWMLSNRGPQIIERDWRPGFTIDLQLKDLRLVRQAADELGVPLLGTDLIFELYRTLQAQGLGDQGNHMLIKALENLAGFEVGS